MGGSLHTWKPASQCCGEMEALQTGPGCLAVAPAPSEPTAGPQLALVASGEKLYLWLHLSFPSETVTGSSVSRKFRPPGVVIYKKLLSPQ